MGNPINQGKFLFFFFFFSFPLPLHDTLTHLILSTSYPNYDPGGELYPPTPSSSLLLDLKIVPRHSIYVSSETTGAFIVDAALSRIHGAYYIASSGQSFKATSNASSTNALIFSITVEGNDKPLVQNNVTINTTSNLFDFDLTSLEPRTTAYHVLLHGTTVGGNQTYTAATDLYYLPDKTTGSVTKIDNLNGGLLFRNNSTTSQFAPVFPFGFYTNYGGYLELSLENVQTYADYGFNTIHPIASYSPNVTTVFAYMDSINLLFQYDMRGTYQNLTSVAEQVNLAKDYSSLLLYYTADEPDGNQDPLNATSLAYDTIAAMDKYHPVSLVLNCANYYFATYGAATDILMEDAYPIGINATYSKWGTVCNATYGDCGCDDCKGELSDVSARLDDFTDYQEWLGWWPKPTWAVPQSFYGEGYWSRNPTVAETWAMNLLSVNHGAKGIMLWTFPTEDDLAEANAQQAKVLSKEPVLNFLTGDQPTVVIIPGYPMLDIAYWIVGGKAMVGVANLDYEASEGAVTVPLHFSATGIDSQPWGSLGWSLTNTTLNVGDLPALATSLLILNM